MFRGGILVVAFLASFLFILVFWKVFLALRALISSFWPFVLLFPLILAFWAVISFHFGLLRLQGGILYIFGALPVGPLPQVAKNGSFPRGF